jgi:hypothetical protein
MSDALFYDPAVLKVVRAILASRGIRADHDLEDGIGDVVLSCIEHVRASGRPPEHVAQAIAIVRPIARSHSVDEARKRIRRGKSNLGPTGDADEHAREPQPSLDPVDQERMLSAIRAVLKDDQIEALSDVGAGFRQKALAAESHASPPAMRKRVQKSRKKALLALGAKGYWVTGGFAALLAVAIGVYFGAWRESQVARRTSANERSREIAAQQRRAAGDACRQRNWDLCEKSLDRAAEIDADGERGAEVMALRAAIARGRGSGETR